MNSPTSVLVATDSLWRSKSAGPGIRRLVRLPAQCLGGLHTRVTWDTSAKPSHLGWLLCRLDPLLQGPEIPKCKRALKTKLSPNRRCATMMSTFCAEHLMFAGNIHLPHWQIILRPLTATPSGCALTYPESHHGHRDACHNSTICFTHPLSISRSFVKAEIFLLLGNKETNLVCVGTYGCVNRSFLGAPHPTIRANLCLFPFVPHCDLHAFHHTSADLLCTATLHPVTPRPVLPRFQKMAPRL